MIINKFVSGKLTYFMDEDGQYHNENDEPAYLYNGNVYWYKNGLLHRENGPAVIAGDGAREWYKNDRLHREDGPAVITPHSPNKYYIRGEFMSRSEFWQYKIKNNTHII